MSIINGYCTLAEFKEYLRPSGQTLTTDTTDDAFIENCIERASRRLEDLMSGRTFYPRVESHVFDMPCSRTLRFDDDLLEVISLTNGDSTAIASTEYTFEPANRYPRYALKLKDSSVVYWQYASTGSVEQIITLAAIWGYREYYSIRGWRSAGTLGAAMATTTGLTYTMTAGHTLDTGGGQIVRVDNELMITASAGATSMVVVARGDNGSTAATHDNGATVYVWQHQEDINGLGLEIAHMMYKSKSGENVETTAVATAAGVVITPRSLPMWAQELISKYRKRT